MLNENLSGENNKGRNIITLQLGRIDYMAESETELVEKVHRALETGMDTRRLDINITARGNEIELVGIVDWLEEKNKAEGIVKGIPGVSKVDNGLTVAMDGDVSDQEITAGVLDKLEHQKLENIGAETHDGTVSLLGHATKEETAKALELASQVRGVKEVYSQVKREDS